MSEAPASAGVVVARLTPNRPRTFWGGSGPAGEEVVAAAVVEVQVCVDDDVDAGEIEVLLAQWPQAGIEVGRRRMQLRHAGVDQHARVGMVDDVHVDRHPLALGEQVGNADWRDGDRGGGVHCVPTAAVVVDM